MQNIDFNLLIALDALLTEGSVTAAAERLHLSVPAMSRTLDRIRRMFGDPLFVRAGKGVVPTPRAEQLREPVRALILQANSLLFEKSAFDAGSLQRVFTVRADDGAVALLGPRLIEALAVRAPQVTVRFIAQGKQDVVALREGLIDIDIGVIEETGPEVVRQALVRDNFLAVMREEHPLSALPALTPPTFAAARHVTVSRRGVLSGPVDAALAEAGLSRHISAVTHSFADALAIARRTDLIATVPDKLTAPVRHGLYAIPLPVSTPPLTLSQAWHPRFNGDPAHQMLRQLIHEISGTM